MAIPMTSATVSPSAWLAADTSCFGAAGLKKSLILRLCDIGQLGQAPDQSMLSCVSQWSRRRGSRTAKLGCRFDSTR